MSELKMFYKVLILLPNIDDQIEANKLDKSKYEVHFLHASDNVKDKASTTPVPDDQFLSQAGFLTTYVDRAVDYVNEKGITAIMFGHDMSSVMASVVCERTGLRGPSLESTFRCLHKYYSRKTAEQGMPIWFDYIYLDEPAENFRDKVVSYPCFLKAPFLAGSRGCFRIRSEAELVAALAKLKPFLSPFFMRFSEFFQKYLDLEKFPLAVQNIAVLEEYVEFGKEYAGEGWIDDDGNFTMYSTTETLVSPKKRETILSFVQPLFTLDDASLLRLVKFTESIGRSFGLRNTFFDVEMWKRGDEFTLVEVNSRCIATQSSCYKEMWGVSVYEAAVYLACGEIDTLRKTKTAIVHKDGEPIAGLFGVYTTGEGKGKDLFDFDYARTGSASEGAFNNNGFGACMYIDEDSPVKHTSANGFNFCRFFLIDDNADRMFLRAKKVVDKILLRPEDRDIFELPVVGNY